MIKKEHLEKAHRFYEIYGGKTIIIARFIPIIRTFAPFVAGIGTMTYVKFIAYNVIGGILWISIFILGGYYFGNLEFVKRNFKIVIFAIIVISVMPAVIEYLKEEKKSSLSFFDPKKLAGMLPKDELKRKFYFQIRGELCKTQIRNLVCGHSHTRKRPILLGEIFHSQSQKQSGSASDGNALGLFV